MGKIPKFNFTNFLHLIIIKLSIDCVVLIHIVFIFFQVDGRDIPIVHRVLKLHEKEDGSVKFLTKGDNNSVDDRGLYAPGQFWLTRKDVVGRARGFLPYVGIVTIIMNEYPKFKYAVLACLGLYVLIHRE